MICIDSNSFVFVNLLNNFFMNKLTDIKETLQGVVNVLIDVKPKYPIVIRRAGPNDLEAKKMVEKAKLEHGLDIHYFDENIPFVGSNSKFL